VAVEVVVEEEGLDLEEEAAVDNGVDLLEPETLVETMAAAVEVEALLTGGETRLHIAAYPATPPSGGVATPSFPRSVSTPRRPGLY